MLCRHTPPTRTATRLQTTSSTRHNRSRVSPRTLGTDQDNNLQAFLIDEFQNLGTDNLSPTQKAVAAAAYADLAALNNGNGLTLEQEFEPLARDSGESDITLSGQNVLYPGLTYPTIVTNQDPATIGTPTPGGTGGFGGGGGGGGGVGGNGNFGGGGGGGGTPTAGTPAVAGFPGFPNSGTPAVPGQDFAGGTGGFGGGGGGGGFGAYSGLPLVRSYRTVSPLPVRAGARHRRSVLCGTVLRVAPTGR